MSWPEPLPRPYPPVVHHGEGEVSAWVRPADAPVDLTVPTGVTCGHLATGDRTSGRFGL